MKPINVVLADDHEIVREGMRRLLDQDSGIAVVAEAATGEEAYRAYAAHRPDVVVLDLSMPGMGGLGAAARIRARDRDSRIVVLSAHDDPPSVRRAMKMGILGYISKSSAGGHLVEAVQSVARGRRYLDPHVAKRLDREQSGTQANPVEVLSNREFEVFRLLATGHSVAEIARLLSVSPKTAGTHHTRVMQKLGLANVAQLVHVALEYGVIEAADPKRPNDKPPAADSRISA